MKLDKVKLPPEPRFNHDEPWGAYHHRREAYLRAIQNLRGDVSVGPSCSGLSCAFPSVRGKWANTEQVVWNQFCWVMTELKKYKKPCLIPLTDKEPLAVQLFMSCPWVTHVVSTKSRHGDYTAYIFTVEVN